MAVAFFIKKIPQLLQPVLLNTTLHQSSRNKTVVRETQIYVSQRMYI